MQFGFIGINYKNAPLDIRDRISFTESSKIDYLQKAEAGGIKQCLVLATCYRSEIFFFFDEDSQMDYMIKLYKDTFKNVDLSDILIYKSGDEAIAYIFRIAAGLESAVLGEDQILGQLKDALMLASALGYAKKEMHRVVENAMACAKKIKTDYKISEIPLSVSYIGIKEVERQTGFEGKNILIVGSGDTAKLALRYVYEYNVAEVVLCSRNIAHAKKVKEDFPKIKIVLYDERMDYLDNADIVISATSSPHYTIFANECHYNKDMTFLDLAAPRDIDPKVVTMFGSKLINLDTLDQISKENQKERERLMDLCKGELDSAVGETITWLFESRVDSTIQSLHQRCDEITEDSFSYLERKLDLSDREKKILRKILAASLKKLIREPIVELKQLDSAESQEEYTKMLNNLFHLETADTASAGE
ncbi:MAG: glutamyl-tRNA reductase [Lachnospiraceae bacterium]|nr:glutamyl-tRNA reductase [Lachnospiraceae bacterium]